VRKHLSILFSFLTSSFVIRVIKNSSWPKIEHFLHSLGMEQPDAVLWRYRTPKPTEVGEGEGEGEGEREESEERRRERERDKRQS
jgi:hypothetical protein